MKKYLYISTAVFFLSPLLSFAQSGSPGPDLSWFTKFANSFTNLLKLIVPLLIGLALVVFLWGVVQFIMSDDSGREEGRKKMLWGIVGLFVMVAVWGIVKLLGTIVGVRGGETVTAPKIPTSSS